MKRLSFFILTLLLVLTSCEKSLDESIKTINGFYDYMHYEVNGGGQIYFDLYATDNPNKLKAVVSKYNFRDTTIQLVINKTSDNVEIFSNFNKALNNEIQLSGDFTQPTAPTGIWVDIYFRKNNDSVKLTNVNLRNTLVKVQALVVAKIK